MVAVAVLLGSLVLAWRIRAVPRRGAGTGLGRSLSWRSSPSSRWCLGVVALRSTCSPGAESPTRSNSMQAIVRTGHQTNAALAAGRRALCSPCAPSATCGSRRRRHVWILLSQRPPARDRCRRVWRSSLENGGIVSPAQTRRHLDRGRPRGPVGKLAAYVSLTKPQDHRDGPDDGRRRASCWEPAAAPIRQPCP